jgi:putative FmdB family regulatory protein
MPIYEYVCQDCGHALEAIQKVADPQLVDCPACCHASLKKKLTASAFRLSGSGWYETDFKTGDKKRNLTADTDAKPAAKEDSADSAKPAGDSGSAAPKTAAATATTP